MSVENLTAELVAWAKVWRTETCSRLDGCDVDGSHASNCSITVNERGGCRLVDEINRDPHSPSPRSKE